MILKEESEDTSEISMCIDKRTPTNTLSSRRVLNSTGAVKDAPEVLCGTFMVRVYALRVGTRPTPNVRLVAKTGLILAVM